MSSQRKFREEVGGGMNTEAVLIVKPFEYQAYPCSDPPIWSGVASLMSETEIESAPFAVPPDSAADQLVGDPGGLQDRLQARFDAGRHFGFDEGRRSEQESQATRLRVETEQSKMQIAEIVQKFDAARDGYLREIEHDVVELALAIAARILRREAQMDPLLLTGAVRVALGQLARTTKVRLRVPQAELSLWTEAMGFLPDLASHPEVMIGDGFRPGDCVIETELGSADLSLGAQLAEIERGFFDRPAQGNEPTEGGTRTVRSTGNRETA